MKLIGFIGNACTGKTTAAFGLVQHAKLRGLNIGYINDLCRSMPFSRELFDSRSEARLAVLFKQLQHEMEHAVRTDIDYLVTERTPLDWWLYYFWTCLHIGEEPCRAVTAMVSEMMRRYELIFYMDDKQIEYIKDGFRPPSVQLREEMSIHYKDRWNYGFMAYRDSARPVEVEITAPDVAERCEDVKRHFDWMMLGLETPC